MGKKIIFTTEQINEIIERYENGESCLEIGRVFNVSNKTIRRLLDKNDIQNRGNRKHFFNEDVFKSIDSAEKAYWLGFITADGYVNEDRGVLSIKLNAKDRTHLEKFIKCINGDENMIKTEYHNITGNELSNAVINSRTIVDDLVKLNIRQCKSSKEQVAPIPKEYIRDYIRGLWDGDGHIGEKELDLISSVEVLDFVQAYLIEECNITKNRIIDHCNTHRFYVCKNRVNVLKHLYYNDCVALDRKYETAWNVVNLIDQKKIIRQQIKEKLKKEFEDKVGRLK